MKNTKSRVMTLALLILSAAVLLAACAPKPAEPAATAVVTNAPAATAVVTDAPAATAVVTDAPAATAVATDAPAAAPAAEAALPVLTAEELAKYDGLDGNKAYVAFEGTVYDVSNAPQWVSGVHGGNKAGTDITKNLKAAPHGTAKLDGLPVVGTFTAP